MPRPSLGRRSQRRKLLAVRRGARPHAGAASGGYEESSDFRILELRSPHADVTEGKAMPGHRETLSEHASPLASQAGAPPFVSGGAFAETPAFQAPAYFDGSLTVRRLRPFFLRRLRVSRPQRVDMRVRKPWVFTRRLFLGRYVGFPMRELLQLD